MAEERYAQHFVEIHKKLVAGHDMPRHFLWLESPALCFRSRKHHRDITAKNDFCFGLPPILLPPSCTPCSTKALRQRRYKLNGPSRGGPTSQDRVQFQLVWRLSFIPWHLDLQSNLTRTSQLVSSLYLPNKTEPRIITTADMKGGKRSVESWPNGHQFDTKSIGLSKYMTCMASRHLRHPPATL